MKAGAMALARVQQADGRMKARPVVILQEMPPYGDFLVCAVSSQLRHECAGFDEIIQPGDDDFVESGLKVSSLIRLGLIATIPQTAILGELGHVSRARLDRLRQRLGAFLNAATKTPD
jgi:mRNA interferase MazF